MFARIYLLGLKKENFAEFLFAENGGSIFG